MNGQRIFDTFMWAGETDILECRLAELETVPDLTHIIVEADVTHAGRPRPYVYPDVEARYSAWADRIVYVQATGLPDGPRAWDREHAQREWVWRGLGLQNAAPDDIVLHGDADEIPTVGFVEQAAWASGPVRARMRLHAFAVDWLHPDPWWGTIATRADEIKSFPDLRASTRHGHTPYMMDAGWHLSWLGTPAQNTAKLENGCHPELAAWAEMMESCYADGVALDGQQMRPVTVDESWPRWIREGHAPEGWYRQKGNVA